MTPEQLAALRAVHQGGLFALTPRTTVGDIVEHIDAQAAILKKERGEFWGTIHALQRQVRTLEAQLAAKKDTP